MTDLTITHEDGPEAGRFVTHLDGHEAVLTYTKPRAGVVDAQHTLVPPALEGRGVGKALFEALIADAQARGYQVIPSCWFIALHAKRRPELQQFFL